MITDDTTEANRADACVALFLLTHDEHYREEAVKLISPLYETAPKIIYKEALDLLKAK